MESSPFWNPESTVLEFGIEYPESGIHSMESGIQDCPGFPYMGRLRTPVVRGITDSLSFRSFQNPGFRKSTPRNFPDSGFERFPEIRNPFYLTLGNLWGFNLAKIDSLWQFLSRSVAKRTDRFSFGVQALLFNQN